MINSNLGPLSYRLATITRKQEMNWTEMKRNELTDKFQFNLF